MGGCTYSFGVEERRRVGRPEAVEGRAEDFRSYPKVGLSADFWLAGGIDDVTVQKSADSVPPNAHTLYYCPRFGGPSTRSHWRRPGTPHCPGLRYNY